MSAQDEANQAAKEFACNSAAQLALLANPDAPGLIVDGVPTGPVAPGYTSPPGTHTFFNGPATCTVACADGSTTFFTTPPGRFSGATQAQADQVALSYACQQAQLGKLCLSSLDGECCLGQSAGFVVNATGATGTGSWIQTGGALPPGLTAVGNNRQLLISGTPTTIGDYAFEFKCTLTSGISRTKTFSLKVMGITDTSLPGFAKNTPYSFQLTASGGTPPYTFALVSGFLPAGLHLSSSGLISGTPIVDFDSYPVGIAVNDGHVICRKDLSFVSLCVPAIAPTLETFYSTPSSKAVYATVTGKLWGISGTNMVEISPTSGAILNTLAIPCDSIEMVFYENTNERVYISYGAGLNTFLASINPITRSVVNTVSTGGATGSGDTAAYDPLRNKLWIIAGTVGSCYVLDCASFTFSTISFPGFPTYGSPTDIVYVSSTDQMVVSVSKWDGGLFEWHAALDFIDPGTLAESVVDLGYVDGAIGSNYLVYCPNNNRIYLLYLQTFVANNKAYIINPSAPSLASFLTLPGNLEVGVYNSCTNRVQIFSVNNATKNITCSYINAATNLVVGTVATTHNAIGYDYPIHVWYDDDHSRVWFGLPTELLKFT